jgi:hypothetical protein
MFTKNRPSLNLLRPPSELGGLYINCMRNFYPVLLLLSLVVSCNQATQEPLYFNEVDISYKISELDTLSIKLEVFSEDGFFRVSNGKLFYFDPIFSNVYELDSNGFVVKEFLGKGDGPQEIRQDYVWHTFTNEGESIFLGRQSDIHVFDNEFNRKEDFMYVKNQTQAQYRNPRSYDEGMYSLDIIYGNAFLSSSTLTILQDSIVVVPVRILERVNPDFNMTTKEYYSSSNTLGVININSGKFERTFGNWPLEYKDRILPSYDNKFTTNKNDTILVSYNASHRIQAYSSYPELTLLYEFGVKQDKLMSNYIDFKSQNDRKDESGFYSHIYYNAEDNIIFRSYINDKSSLVGGVQMYKDKKLIGDQQTLGRFNVLGKLEGYYYAEGTFNEEKEQLQIFKFKISTHE